MQKYYNMLQVCAIECVQLWLTLTLKIGVIFLESNEKHYISVFFIKSRQIVTWGNAAYLLLAAAVCES